MNYIVESINKNGLVTSPYEFRRTSVKSGDVIDFGEFDGVYPHTSGRYGRVWTVEDRRVTYCCEPGSAFLSDDGHADISGGPFSSCDIKDLEPTYETHTLGFWNWGNNGSGAGHGVDYYIPRPLFRLNPQEPTGYYIPAGPAELHIPVYAKASHPDPDTIKVLVKDTGLESRSWINIRDSQYHSL